MWWLRGEGEGEQGLCRAGRWDARRRPAEHESASGQALLGQGNVGHRTWSFAVHVLPMIAA